jgi:alpha-tubulin suppressor-like RCC1 family protein
MSLPMRNVASLVVAVAVTAIMGGGCRDDSITIPKTSTDPKTSPDPMGLIVSSPMLASASAVTSGASSVATVKESLAYVSLVPGTAPGGVHARIENRVKEVVQTVSVIEGGFDPVGIAARVGDTLDVAVTNTASIELFHAVVAVRPPRRPRVVRTSPPAKKTDVPVNMVIQVVFSAPIDPTTLTTQSMQLFRDGTPVAGTVRFSDSLQIKAEFLPTDLLVANASYLLVITQAIRDVNQMPLETIVNVPFTTGTREDGASKVRFMVFPMNTTAGVVISPALAFVIQDASGSTITDATGPVTIELATNHGVKPVILGTTTVNAVNGVATFDNLSVEQAGTYRVMAYYAASRPLQTDQSVWFSVVPAAASKLVLVGPKSVDARTQFVAHATVQDAFGNTVLSAANSVALSLASNPGGATLAGTLTVPTLSGVAQFANLTLDKPGVGYVVQATSGMLTAGTLQLDVRNRDGFAAVSAGGAHTCAVTHDGYAYCWGANANGQVGVGTTIDHASPVLVASGMSSVSAGRSHSCALGNTGLYCWGLNDDYQLGDGTNTTRLSPTGPVEDWDGRPVAGGLVTGGTHTCVIYSYPWQSSEWSSCWGSDVEGQLARFANVTALAAGGSHTCGYELGTVPGLYCWGSNKNGQLGAGSLQPRSPVPWRVASFFGNGAVSAGASHTCASISVAGTGGLHCWGLNDNGQLGDGTTTERSSPVLVSGGPFSSVAAGSSHTCALTSGGAAYCWGANDKGQLGDGTTTMRTSPVPVSGGLKFVSLSAGGGHTCGITVFGTYCWGANGNGQLGNGATADSALPVKVSGQ